MKKILVIILSIVILIPASIFGATYHLNEAGHISNANGISFSKSVNSSPLGGKITFSKFPSLFKSENMFSGCVYDGKELWFVPFSYDKIVSYTKSGESNTIDLSENASSLYCGGAFDGKSIFLSPYGADSILQIDTETKQTHKIRLGKGNNRYKGAFFDGENVWFFPANGKTILCLNSIGEINQIEIPYELEENSSFSGGIIFGETLYLVPENYPEIITMNIRNRDFNKINSEGNSFCGVVSDESFLYFLPKENSYYLKLNTQNGTTEKIYLPENLAVTQKFSGGCFDGRNIWLSPISGDIVLKFDTYWNEFKTYTLETPNESYYGAVFDGESVWFSPYCATSPLKIKGDNTTPTVMNVFLETPAGTTIESELSGIDSDEGDNLVFSVLTPPVNGSVNLSSESGKFIYTAGQKTGEDYFEYYASDNYDKSNIARVTIKITENEIKPSGKYIDLWGHWAEDAAIFLTENNVLTGEDVDSEFYFYPETKMTRAQFIVWVNSALGYEGSISDNTLPFEDLKNAQKWIIKAASGAYHNKLITGSEFDGKLYFNPNNNLTRVEAFIILYNALRPADADDTELGFVDSDTFPNWSVKALKAMKNIGILKGYSDNTLRVYNTVTRGEAAKLLYETLTNMQVKTKTIERLK